MRALIALTIFMGVLIIAGLGVIAVTIIHRLSNPAPVVAVTSPTMPLVPAPGPAGHASIAAPKGTHLAATLAVGAHLVLHFAGGGGKDTLITLDPATGAILETIDLVPDTEHP
jgi:hypothetical protein